MALVGPAVPCFALAKFRRYERESDNFGDPSSTPLRTGRVSCVRFLETRRCGNSIWATGRGGERGFWSSDGSTTLGCNSIAFRLNDIVEKALDAFPSCLLEADSRRSASPS